jgi:hypothetical protein
MQPMMGYSSKFMSPWYWVIHDIYILYDEAYLMAWDTPL